ncbi:angiogenic factor with G patch and FHA domains 1 [Adelges cooleyi]|uniref:angiogenic factor with G patch and FHA domains 1 n=1 Tax=Adelges cooleyi TaxID=133065 RepID=UPI0021800958|nr:angiogenic factor with G patch and FHA domains 1 [Adelges cooleyi]
MANELEIPFRELLENDHPEIFEYLKNAVRMLHRQQNLLAKLKNNGLVDIKKCHAQAESVSPKTDVDDGATGVKRENVNAKSNAIETADANPTNAKNATANVKKVSTTNDNACESSAIKEEGECSEDEEKSTDVKSVDRNRLETSRFLLEETTGMYYDQVTGYYYNLDNGLFYDGNQGCYYYFDVIAQKYRLHSQVHPDATAAPTPCERPKPDGREHCDVLPEIDYGDSDNSVDSGNLIIKEDPEENVEPEEKECKKDSTVDNSSVSCKVGERDETTKEDVKQQLKVIESENKIVDETPPEVTSSPPPSTCEVLDKRYLNLLQYTKLLPAPKNIVHKLTPDGSKAKQYAQIRNWYALKHQLAAIESEIVQYENFVWDRIEQYLCLNKRDDKNSNWKSYKEVKANLSDTQTKLIKSKVVGWPPCIRIIVIESKACKTLIGKLFLITCPGGTIGRSTSRDVIIPDDNVSKLHAEISFVGNVNKVGRGHYVIKDKGSTNGTYLDGKKITKSSSSGEPKHLIHGSELLVGDTKLLCHIHDGMETCNLCEPGIQATAATEEVVKNEIPQKRKHDEELKSLKEKYGLLGCEPPEAVLPKGYKDRAEKRRKTVGSQNAHEKTEVACLSQPIPTKNKGFKLLENMGWTPGKSLGANNCGIKEPIGLDVRDDKMGLGFNTMGGFAQIEQPKINVVVKPSKIRFNFGNKTTNVPIKTNKINFSEDASSEEEK